MNELLRNPFTIAGVRRPLNRMHQGYSAPITKDGAFSNGVTIGTSIG